MQRCTLSIFKTILLLFFFIFQHNSLFANENLIVNGNINISKKTIESYLPANFNYSDSVAINNFQKKLFDTGFFKKIDILKDNKKLIINVIENPLINFFNIESDIKSKKLLDEISNLLLVKENQIFQPHFIKKDIKSISSFLNSLGYLKNEITYQVIQLKDNKINLFYKINQNKIVKIRNISFIGDKIFKSSTLRDVLVSSEHGWWKFLSKTTTVSENLINYDISKLKNFYLDKGYIDVQINSSSVSIVDKDYANLVYSINSGKKYIVKNINIINSSSSLKDKNIDFINKIFLSVKNKNYNFSEIKKIFNEIDEYLLKSNYNLIIKIDEKKKSDFEIDLILNITEDNNVKIVNKIVINGNSITDEFVIRNFLSLSEGDIFLRNKLNKSIEKIQGSGIFKKVVYSIDDINNQNIDINITVTEQPTGEISAGAGAGSNGATIMGAITENNFLGKGIKLSSSVNLGTEKVFGKIDISYPDFKNSGNSLNAKFFVESNDYVNTNYENKIIGASLSTEFEIYDQIFLNPGYSIDLDQVNANSSASAAIKRLEGDYFTNKFFYNISKNTKNKNVNATEGYVLGFGQSLSTVFSDIPFLSNRFYGSFYNILADGFVGSIKYKLETINAFNDDVKFSDRLFVTSSNLRGFSNRGVGPTISSDFVGGNYSFYSNFSSTLPNGLPEKWNAITNIFLDVANVWGVDDNTIKDSDKIRSSIGLGLSWISPIGPISASYSEPMTKAPGDKVEQFNIKIGSAF